MAPNGARELVIVFSRDALDRTSQAELRFSPVTFTPSLKLICAILIQNSARPDSIIARQVLVAKFCNRIEQLAEN
jgi:hypothetical protein